MSSPLDMIIGGGNTAVWAGGIAPVKPITDQTDHYAGGAPSSSGTNASSTQYSRSVLHTAAMLVIAAVVILWVMGGMGFRSSKA
jgi:hypothetical protein